MDSLLKDLAYALRTLRRNLGFTLTATATIALGIGACTAIFSIVNGVLLRPLPYSEPKRLVLIWTELRARKVMDFPFPIPDVKDLRTEAKSFDGVAGLFPPGRATIGGEGTEPEQIRVEAATPNLLPLLGARLFLGRHFTEDDGKPQPRNPPGPPGTPPAAQPAQPPRLPAMVILTYPFWQRKFGGDSSVVGRSIDFGNGKAEIVGVLAPGFELLFPPRTGIDPNVDMWTAARLDFDGAARNTGALRVVARMKDGVTLEQARAEAEGIATTLRERYPVKKTADVHFRVMPMQEDLVSGVRTSILALFGAVTFVLLIACANVANLLIVRASSRHRELVIRAAIGGSQWRLIRQMLTESLVLAVLGGGLGLLLAQSGIDLLIAMGPAKLPRINSISIDPAVLAFTAAATIVTALVCGLVPALRASRPDLVDVLRLSGGSPGLRAGRALRNSVVVAEVALSFVLLIGSGLMVRSFIALQRVDAGYDASNVLTFVLQAPQRQDGERSAFLGQVAERLRAIPGVLGVTAATPLPLDGASQNVPWSTEAGASDPSAFRQANFHSVRPGYFETLRTKLLAGRAFTDEDNVAGTTRVIVDDLLAARAFPNADAVGRTLLVRNLRPNGPNAPQNERVEVIGVVAHQRHESLVEPGREAIFFVENFFGPGAAGRWAIRTSGPPESVAQSVRAAVAEIDPRLPLGEMQPMTAFVDKSIAPTRFAVVLIGIFAAVAGVLAAIGLYGVLATVVRQRTAEIGLRMVLGAPRQSILRLIIGEGLRLSLTGVVLGLIAAFAVTRVLRSLLVSVTPTDPMTFIGMTAVFVVIAAAACWLPARRAAALEPSVALRAD
jgi:putative ABC transport system permease protein